MSIKVLAFQSLGNNPLAKLPLLIYQCLTKGDKSNFGKINLKIAFELKSPRWLIYGPGPLSPLHWLENALTWSCLGLGETELVWLDPACGLHNWVWNF